MSDEIDSDGRLDRPSAVPMADDAEPVRAWLSQHHVGSGQQVGVAFADGIGLGLAVAEPGTNQIAYFGVAVDSPAALIGQLTAELNPRWVWWDRTSADGLIAADIVVDRSWEVVTSHHLLRGGHQESIAAIWCDHAGLDPGRAPTLGQIGLLDDPAFADDGATDVGTTVAGTTDARLDDPESPLLPSGYLRPEWIAGRWRDSPARMAQWARLALEVALGQAAEVADGDDPQRVTTSLHVESAAEFLCAELAADGLPFDRIVATEIIAAAVGPDDDTERRRDERDRAVLDLAPPGRPVDLRNPADVKELLRRVGLDLPDTRAHRLRDHADHHRVVAALLVWRKAERLGNTYGYRWLDAHVRDGRLRGQWASSDGAAGRMTATAGLHNLPSELRPAVRAEPGHVFVRADLGQVEPRVLAAVSGDASLIAATAAADLYQTIADRLSVTRPIAKLAVLGAMYGSTTGEAAHALRSLHHQYPVAMNYLEAAAAAGQRGESVRTIGGRPIHMWTANTDGDIDAARRLAAARGRFARNAVIQGGAAELFKMWAVTVRARGRPIGAAIVLCLHDELLVHVPIGTAERTAELVGEALDEAAYRWSPQPATRFVADVSIVERWSDVGG